MESKNIQYVPGIDHLRAFAATLIVLYHGTQMGEWEGRAQRDLPAAGWPLAKNPFTALVFEGHTSVALFMVLSGFIFTYGAYGHSVRYWPFLKNRFLRTYPLFLVLVALGAASHPGGFSIERLIVSVFGLANFQSNALQLGIFSGMFWAIAVEWQFYVIFPFLFAFLSQHSYRYLFGALLVLLACRWLGYLAGGVPREMGYLMIVGRLDQFLLGMAAGFFYHTMNARFMRWLFVPAAVLVLGVLFWFNRRGGWPTNTAFKLYWPAIEGGVWALFLVTYLAVSPALPRLVSRALCAVGAVSYSMYLWHFPLVAIAFRRGWRVWFSGNVQLDAFLNTLVLILPITIAFSALTYAVIEKPFLRLRVKYLSPLGAPAGSG